MPSGENSKDIMREIDFGLQQGLYFLRHSSLYLENALFLEHLELWLKQDFTEMIDDTLEKTRVPYSFVRHRCEQ